MLIFCKLPEKHSGCAVFVCPRLVACIVHIFLIALDYRAAPSCHFTIKHCPLHATHWVTLTAIKSMHGLQKQLLDAPFD